MWEFFSSLSSIERIFLMVLSAGLIGYALRILSKKNIIKGKDGIEVTDSNSSKSKIENIQTQLPQPIWKKSVSVDKKSFEIGFYSFGNWIKLYGNRWNTALDREGYKLIRELMDSPVDLGNDVLLDYKFWVLDLTDCNIQSSLLSLIIDKSKQFEYIVVMVKPEHSMDVKTISPENSTIKNIKIVVVQ